MDEDLHREIIEEHARHPRNKLELPNADLTGEYRSEKTGNESKVFLKLAADGSVVGASFTGQGSALSLASGSLLTSHVSGNSPAELTKLCDQVESVILKGAADELPGELDVYRTIGRFPERYDCALLAWRALCSALEKA